MYYGFFWCGTYPYWNCLACLLTPHRGNFVAALITALFPASFDHRWQYHSCGKWTVEQVPIDAAGGSLIIPPPKWEYQSEDCRLSATPWALLVQGPALMVVRDTFLAELKTLFGLVVAGFEPGFSDPKARALPLRQSYAVIVALNGPIYQLYGPI